MAFWSWMVAQPRNEGFIDGMGRGRVHLERFQFHAQQVSCFGLPFGRTRGCFAVWRPERARPKVVGEGTGQPLDFLRDLLLQIVPLRLHGDQLWVLRTILGRQLCFAPDQIGFLGTELDDEWRRLSPAIRPHHGPDTVSASSPAEGGLPLRQIGFRLHQLRVQRCYLLIDQRHTFAAVVQIVLRLVALHGCIGGLYLPDSSRTRPSSQPVASRVAANLVSSWDWTYISAIALAIWAAFSGSTRLEAHRYRRGNPSFSTESRRRYASMVRSCRTIIVARLPSRLAEKRIPGPSRAPVCRPRGLQDRETSEFVIWF